MSEIIQGDCLEVLKTFPDKSIDCCVTSPPYYGLRDYGTGEWVGGDPNCPHRRLSKYSPDTITGHAQEELRGNVGDAIYKTVCPLCGAVRVDKQIGLEETPEQYVQRLVDVFHEVKRVLKDDGTLWLNIGDSYNGSGHGRDANGNVNFSELASKQATNKGSVCGTFQKTVVDSCKPKDLIGIPWMLAFALRADGWYLRQDIIWHKPNPMPESVKDRCTKSHEYIFLLSKKPHYYFDYKAIQEPAIWADDARSGQGRIAYDGKRATTESQDSKAQQSFVKITDTRNKRDAWEEKGIRFGGNKYGDNDDTHFQTYSGNEWMGAEVRNKRDVWDITTKAVKEAHFATFPEELVRPCILAGCKVGGTVLDPFFGSGTTGIVAIRLNREYIGIDLNLEYIEIAKKRTANVQMSLEGFMKVSEG